MKELIIKAIPDYSSILNMNIDKSNPSILKFYLIKHFTCERLKNLFISNLTDDITFSSVANSNLIHVEFPAICNNFKEEGTMSIN